MNKSLSVPIIYYIDLSNRSFEHHSRSRVLLGGRRGKQANKADTTLPPKSSTIDMDIGLKFLLRKGKSQLHLSAVGFAQRRQRKSLPRSMERPVHPNITCLLTCSWIKTRRLQGPNAKGAVGVVLSSTLLL